MHVRNSEFEKCALGLLDELYKRDQEKTNQLVTQKLKTWNVSSVYKLAVDADLTDVKTHDSFQASLDKMWRGNYLEKKKFPLWKVRLRVLSVIRNSDS